MELLAAGAARRKTDEWLRSIVASVIERSSTITLDRAELWDLLDNLPAAILISTDRSCSRIVGNRAAQIMLATPYGGNLSQNAPDDERPAFKVYDGDRLIPAEELPMQKSAATGERVGQSECEIRFDDGTAIHIAGHCIPISDADGNLCGSIGAFVDVTARKDEQLLVELMSQEMSHRAKNSAALILAVAQMTVREHLPPEIYAAFEDRVMSVGRLQALGYQGGWKSVSLRETVSDTIRPLTRKALDQFRFDGPEVAIPSAMAQNLGMILHELTTNACKYGALSVAEGVVDLRWWHGTADGDEQIVLGWTETGGPPLGRIERKGFGSRMISALARSMSGTTDTSYPAEGLRFKLIVPL